MTLVGVGSVRGAPGVTTTALLMAGALPAPSLLVEADRAGGTLAVRYGLGREPGLTTLAAAATKPDEWRDHAQDAGGVPVLVGPDVPASSRALWQRAEPRIARTLVGTDATVIADLGRLGSEVPLIDQLSMLVVLVRPIAEHLVTFTHVLPALREQMRGSAVTVVLAGRGEYAANDVAASLGVEILGELPQDERAAKTLRVGGSTQLLGRSRLVRAVVGISARLVSEIEQPQRVGAVR